MLFKTLDRLRTKSKPARQQYAFLVALLLTGSIAGVWALTLPSRFVSESSLADAETDGPFSGLWQTFKGQWGNITDSLASLPNASLPVATTTNQIDMSGVTNPTTTLAVKVPPPAISVLIATSSSASSTIIE